MRAHVVVVERSGDLGGQVEMMQDLAGADGTGGNVAGARIGAGTGTGLGGYCGGGGGDDDGVLAFTTATMGTLESPLRPT